MVIKCVTSWCTAAGAGVLFAAQTPKSEKEIPIIGGATRGVFNPGGAPFFTIKL